MKRFATFLLTLAIASFIGGNVFVFGQVPDAEKWVEINDGDGLLAFSVPEGFLVDKDGGPNYRIVAFARGVTFEIQAEKFNGAKTVFKNLKPRDDENEVELEFASNSGKAKMADVKKFVSNDSLSHRIFLSSGERYYRVFIKSAAPSEQIVSRFLESIVINGSPLQGGKTPKISPWEVMAARDLRTSQEVREARSKKQPKRNDTYSYFSIDAFKPVASTTDPDIRSAVIVDRNPPALLAFLPGQHKVKVVAELLANGLVGKVTVYSNLPEKTIPHIIESALGIKFVPAKKGANYVDSLQVIDYSMNVGKPLIRYNPMPPGPRVQ